MAKALGAADELLAGGQVVIPHLPAMPRGYEFLYSRRTELAASRLLTKAASACERDLDDPTLSPPDLERLAPRQIIVAYVFQYLSELLQVGEWRNRLIEWDPAARERRGYSEPATEDPWTPKQRVADDADHERAVLGLAHALEHTLAPWFGHSAGFNYRALRDLTHLPAHPFAASEENIPPTSPYAVLLPKTVANAQATPPPPTTRSKRTRSSSKSRRRKGKR